MDILRLEDECPGRPAVTATYVIGVLVAVVIAFLI